MGIGTFFKKLCFGTIEPPPSDREKRPPMKEPKPETSPVAANPFRRKSPPLQLTVSNLVRGIIHAARTALKLDIPEGDELGIRYYVSAYTVASYMGQLKVKNVDDFRIKAHGQHEFEFVFKRWNVLQANFSKLQEQIPVKLDCDRVYEALNRIIWDEEDEPGYQGFEQLAAALGTLIETLENIIHISPASRGPRTLSKLVITKVPYTDDRGIPLNPLTAMYIMSKQGLREVRFDHLSDKRLKILLQKVASDALLILESFLEKHLAIGPLCLDSVLNWNWLMHEHEDDIRVFMLDIMMGITITVVQILEQLRDDLESIYGARYADMIDKIKSNVTKYQIGASSHHYLSDAIRSPLNAVDNPELSELLTNDRELRRGLETGKLLTLISSIKSDLQTNCPNYLSHAENLRIIFRQEREIARSFTELDDIVALQEDGF